MRKSIHSPGQKILQALLKTMREEAGLKQSELAERIGRPQALISRYEHGEKMLDLPELRQLCTALGTTLPELVSRYEAALSEADL